MREVGAEWWQTRFGWAKHTRRKQSKEEKNNRVFKRADVWGWNECWKAQTGSPKKTETFQVPSVNWRASGGPEQAQSRDISPWKGENEGLFDSPDALAFRTLWSSSAIQSAQAGHLHARRPAAAQVGYIPPAQWEKKTFALLFIQLKFEEASRIIVRFLYHAVWFTPVDQCAPTHGVTKIKRNKVCKWESRRNWSSGLLVSDSELSSPHWSPSLPKWRKFLLQTSLGWDAPTGATWLSLAARWRLVANPGTARLRAVADSNYANKFRAVNKGKLLLD